MGKLRGDLEILPFADLLQLLVNHERVGTLTVTRGKDRKAIHIAKEGLRLLTGGRSRAKSLGEILLRTGKVSRQELKELLAEQKRTGTPLGEMLGRGSVTREDMDRALRGHAEAQVLAAMENSGGYGCRAASCPRWPRTDAQRIGHRPPPKRHACCGTALQWSHMPPAQLG